MKLNQALSQLNQVEKVKFISCLDKICSAETPNNKVLSKSLSQIDGQIKDATEGEITQLFKAVSSSFQLYIAEQIALLDAQTIMLINILTRDGKSIVRASWLEHLYDKEWQTMSALSKSVLLEIEQTQNSEDYNDHGSRLSIYKNCFDVAFTNDERINREAKITDDERTILNTLSYELGISTDEAFSIEHLAKPAPRDGVSSAINTLREMGIIFFNRKRSEVIIADEIRALLLLIAKKELPDKYTLRILRALTDSELSNILKAYGKKIRGVERKEKIQTVLHSGISVSSILKEDMFSPDVQINQRKERLKFLIAELDISTDKIGSTIDERISVIIESLLNLGDEEFNHLSATGYKELYTNLKSNVPDLLKRIEDTFEIENAETLDTERLKLVGITPLDILYLYSNDEVRQIRDNMSLSKRGNPRHQILNKFASANDKFIELYSVLSQRDISNLRSSGIDIPEAEIGSKFEEITKSIFEELGMIVDEDLRKEINTAKDKIDILISLNDTDVIICEAKTSKNGDFSKYSSTSRQVKSYVSRCENFGKRVAQVLIIAPSFSEDFVESSEMDTEVNISLLEASGLKQIFDAYKSRRNPKFSAKLLTKGGLLKADRIAKTI